MSQRDERVYIQHMIDNSNKVISFVKDISREDFDKDEKLRLALTHLLQVIGEAARKVSPELYYLVNYKIRSSSFSIEARKDVVSKNIDKINENQKYRHSLRKNKRFLCALASNRICFIWFGIERRF